VDLNKDNTKWNQNQSPKVSVQMASLAGGGDQKINEED